MQYIHVKNLEKYNPGYTDRSLIWCKIYFSMINASYDFENMDDIDKWRLIALIMLELQMKKPIPYDEAWLQKKISNNKRPISLTLKMLHNFVEIVTEDNEPALPRVEKSRIEKSILNKFVKPTIQEVSDYCSERKNGIDAKYFIDSNDTKGWVVGKTQTPMKDWKAAIRTWEGNNYNTTTKASNWHDEGGKL